MSSAPEDRFDKLKPALIVKYGSTRRKFRPLDNDIMVLGRATSCDIGLVSPEVAPVHCVIVRQANGWRIRDCSGRATRVNGEAVNDAMLKDGDVIQVGTFSFEAQLPPGSWVPAPATSPAAAPASDPVDTSAIVERLQRSRRRLVETALHLRQRLREQGTENREVARREAEMDQLETRLRKAHQEQIARQARANEEKITLERRAAELDSYAKHLRKQVEKVQRDQMEQVRSLLNDKEDYEADLVRQRVELNNQQRQQAEWQHDLARRQQEMETTATLLMHELSEEREELVQQKQQLESEREQIQRERAYLDQQREELVHMRAEVERMKDLTPITAPPAEEPLVPEPLSSRETQIDAPADRLESARRLLRELMERRKARPGQRPSDSAERTPR